MLLGDIMKKIVFVFILVSFMWGCEEKTKEQPSSSIPPLQDFQEPVIAGKNQEEEESIVTQDVMEVFGRILNKPPEQITKEDLLEISIYIPQKDDDIESVIKVVKNLEELYLNPSIDVKDYSIIQELPNLKVLWMANHEINSLNFLYGHKSLEELDIKIPNNKDLDPLASLKQLKSLRLVSSRATNTQHSIDLNPLTSLKQLKNLTLDFSTIDIAQLPILENLEELTLDSANIHNINAINNFPKLKKITISGGRLYDFISFQPMRQLETLTFSTLLLDSIDFVNQLPNLKNLDVSYNPFADLSPLANVPELQDLNINGTKASDLSPLANLSQLERLNILNTQVTSIQPLLNLKKLKVVILNKEKVSDWEFLLNIPGIQIEDNDY